jgi:hypothetical protein
MSSSPSARPPSSRRPPDLDSPEARAFVEGVATNQEPVAARDVERAVAIPPKPPEAQKELLRPLTLRIPDSLHRRLLYIAENGSKSMNQFAIDALAPAVDAAIEKIRRRKELGLD